MLWKGGSAEQPGADQNHRISGNGATHWTELGSWRPTRSSYLYAACLGNLVGFTDTHIAVSSWRWELGLAQCAFTCTSLPLRVTPTA